MKSLLVVGAPRSMTSLTHELIARMTDLRPPAEEFPDGEIFNCHYWNRRIHPGLETYPDDVYEEMRSYVDQYTARNGVAYAIKDVAHPAFWVRYMDDRPDSFTVFFTYRDYVDIAYASIQRISRSATRSGRSTTSMRTS